MSSEPSPDERRLRLRAVLNAQFAVILAVCLLAAAAGAGLVYTTHVEPGTETETRTVAALTVDTEYVHSAEVTEPNSVFATGTVLDDRNTYFTRIAPELDVSAETSYAAADARDVDIALESVLVIRNVGDGVVYWSDRETVATEQATGVDSGEAVTASFTIDSGEIDEAAASIEDELGASPGETETFVATTVDVDGTIGGEPTSYTRTIEMDVEHGGDTYTVNDPGPQSDTTDRTEQVTVERTYGPLRSIGGPALFLLGAIGAVGLVYVRRETELALTPAESAYLSYRDDRSEFDEWITQFRLPPSVHERETATAETLRDLVDFAIDNDIGVVEDPETGAFHAVSGAFVYTYRPPLPSSSGSPSEAASDSDSGDGADEAVAANAQTPDATAGDGVGEQSDEAGIPDEAWVNADATDGNGDDAGDGVRADALDDGDATGEDTSN